MTKSTPPVNLYVYYRVSATGEDPAPAIAARFIELLRAAGVQPPRLLRRPETDAAGRQTWMEVYEPWNPLWQPIVERAFRDSGMAAQIEGERHSELFIDLEKEADPV